MEAGGRCSAGVPLFDLPVFNVQDDSMYVRIHKIKSAPKLVTVGIPRGLSSGGVAASHHCEVQSKEVTTVAQPPNNNMATPKRQPLPKSPGDNVDELNGGYKMAMFFFLPSSLPHYIFFPFSFPKTCGLFLSLSLSSRFILCFIHLSSSFQHAVRIHSIPSRTLALFLQAQCNLVVPSLSFSPPSFSLSLKSRLPQLSDHLER